MIGNARMSEPPTRDEGCAPLAGSASSVRQSAADYAFENYSKAVNYFDEAPPDGYICANCGDSTEDAGRFRDDPNEIYECSTCGSSMCLPPQNVESSHAAPDVRHSTGVTD